MDVSGWIHCCYRSSLATVPVCRTDKPGWYAEHVKHIELSKNSRVGHVLLIGDDFIESLAHHPRVWSKYFGPLQALNFGLRGDRTQHILWRVETGAVPVNAETIIIHAGVNNLVCDHSRDIANGIGCIALMCLKHKPNARILLCGLLPCDISRKKKIRNVNRYLKLLCSSGYISNCVYVKPDDDWFLPDGSLNLVLYRNGFSEDGMDKFAKPIKDVINNLNEGIKVEMSSDDSEVSTDEDVGNFPVNVSLYSAKASMKGNDKAYRFPVRQKRRISSCRSNDSFRSRSHSLRRQSTSVDRKRKTSRHSRQSSSSRSRSRSRSSQSRSSSRPISPVFTGKGSRSRSRSLSPVFTAKSGRSRSRSRCKSKSRSTSRSAERKRWIERAQQKVYGDTTDSFELISTWSISRSGSPAANSPATKSSKNEKHSMKRVVKKKKVSTSASKEDKNSTKKKSPLTTKENDVAAKKKSPTSTQKGDNGIKKESVPISSKEDDNDSTSSSSPSPDKATVNSLPPLSTLQSNSKTPLPAGPDPEAEKTQHMYDKFLEELEQINKKETDIEVQSGNGELNGKVMETA